MHRLCFVLFLSVFAQYVAGNLIREVPNDVTTKDVPLPGAEVDDMIPTDVTAPVVAPNKSCAQIGESCTFHGECCTNACLGYLKKCVSGSG